MYIDEIKEAASYIQSRYHEPLDLAGSLTVVSIFSLTKSLKTLIISMLLSFFIVKFSKLYVVIRRII